MREASSETVEFCSNQQAQKEKEEERRREKPEPKPKLQKQPQQKRQYLAPVSQQQTPQMVEPALPLGTPARQKMEESSAGSAYDTPRTFKQR